MPRAETAKIYRTFVKGLITEASPLTYPENASTDEDNMILSRRGNRARRLGVDFETNYVLLVLDGESAAAVGDVIPTDTDTGSVSDGDALSDDAENFPLGPSDLEPF